MCLLTWLSLFLFIPFLVYCFCLDFSWMSLLRIYFCLCWTATSISSFLGSLSCVFWFQAVILVLLVFIELCIKFWSFSALKINWIKRGSVLKISLLNCILITWLKSRICFKLLLLLLLLLMNIWTSRICLE